jgi:hypothetical protein
MPATQIDEQESDHHQHPADNAELGAGHENELLKPRLEQLGESKVRQTFKKANQSNDRKEIPPRHVSPSSNLDGMGISIVLLRVACCGLRRTHSAQLDSLKELLPILRGFA